MGCGILSFQRTKLALGKGISYTPVPFLSMGSNDSWCCIRTKSPCPFDGSVTHYCCIGSQLTDTLNIPPRIRIHDTLAHCCETSSNSCFLDHFAAWIVCVSLKSGQPSICSNLLAYLAANANDDYVYHKATSNQCSAFMV